MTLAVALLAILAVTTSVAAQPAPEARARPTPVADARAAIENGVNNLCGWYLASEGHSLPAMQQTAFNAGYRRGASVEMIPLADMRDQPSFSALNFTAVVVDAPAQGSGVVAFVTFHNPACQIQIFGYQDHARAFVAGLADAGWRAAGAETRSEQVAAQRWYGSLNDKPVTLVVNRWAGEQPNPSGLDYILNVVAGENAERGVLE